jgi:hypothetical protein
MKTDTRRKIMALIRSRCAEGVRPVEMVRHLGVTAQAVHYHLRALLSSGELEVVGRGPMTRYVVAGIPRFDAAIRWATSAAPPGQSPSQWVCESRDVFLGRLARISALSKEGLSDREIPLLISAVGEIGNNCFDHNLGKWRDSPGCWFEIQVTGKKAWTLIADRGQGIFRSIERVLPKIVGEQEALRVAFEQVISGRAPENRGNGLKFVRGTLSLYPQCGIACRSGKGLVDYGPLGPECRSYLEKPATPWPSTVTLVVWSLK